MGIPTRSATIRRKILVVAVDKADAKYLRNSLEDLEHQVIAMVQTGTGAIDLASATLDHVKWHPEHPPTWPEGFAPPPSAWPGDD